MKKSLLALLFISQLSLAHEIVRIDSPKNPVLKKFQAIALKARVSHFIVTHTRKIKRVSPKVKGDSLNDTIERIVKFTLHRLYPITGDEGGYSLSPFDEGSSWRDVEKKLEYLAWLTEDEGRNYKFSDIKKLIHEALENRLLVLMGNGSGNNTAADIIVFADYEEMEFVILMASNFGSDD